MNRVERVEAYIYSLKRKI